MTLYIILLYQIFYIYNNQTKVVYKRKHVLLNAITKIDSSLSRNGKAYMCVTKTLEMYLGIGMAIVHSTHQKVCYSRQV